MNIKKYAESFFNSFHSNHVILYIGQSATNEEIQQYLSKCAWSGIITSRKDPEFSGFFGTEERTPFEYCSRADIPVKPLHRKKLPIMRLNGIQDKEAERESICQLMDLYGYSEEEAYEQENEQAQQKARDFLYFLPELLDHVNPLVIVGVNTQTDWALLHKVLIPLLNEKVTDGSVTVWDMPESAEPGYEREYHALKKICERKNFGFYSVSLADVIQTRGAELGIGTDSTEDETGYDTDTYYQGQKPTSISQSDLLMFKNVGTLLTERTIYKIRPFGRERCRRWFANFLESSSYLGPQWYGYLPQSTFYVKRSYEDALVQLVRKMLDGRNIGGSADANRPIILAGDPGSSKSITLGALAYRIYNEQLYPILYISKDSFLSTNIGTSFDELDEALRFLGNNAEGNTRILVIWDSSAYKAGVERAQRLLDHLKNRGRSVVLVCSSYNMNNLRDASTGYYRLNDQTGGFEKCNVSEAQVFEQSGCYFVQATREMNEKEQAVFWQRVREYSGINESTISQFRKKLKDEGRNQIFDYYYMLISVLRENLEKSLQSEQSKVYPYVEKEIRKALGEIYADQKRAKQLSPMYRALLEAGLDPSMFASETEKEETKEDDELNEKLECFNICVALFSRFKLSVPYNLAYTLLLGETQTDQYAESSRNLYNIVTSEIPWIYYGEDENGSFSFRFRNPLEADIFLRNHDFTGEKQIELLCRILDVYGADYRRSRCVDISFTENIQALLRLMGPNSTYTPFESRQEEHLSILERLNILIDKVQELIDVYGVPDEDAGFASIIVTFTREYYGYIWNHLYCSMMDEGSKPWEHDPVHFSEEMYISRMEQLARAVALAESSVEDLEQKELGAGAEYYGRQHLVNQRYSLVVEIAQCNMRLEEIANEYKRYCQANGKTPDAKVLNRKLSYQSLYRKLWPVILGNPTNGYAYNALFRVFEQMYEQENLSEAQKMQHLSEIMQVVDTCDSMGNEIVNRGNRNTDELTNHINRIKDLSTGLQITLDTIRRHRKGEPAKNESEQVCFELYDEMLEANNAAAITFICQKELQNIPNGTRELNTTQMMYCASVYDFIREPDNLECICQSAFALSMLIRVFWMRYNGTVLNGAFECQTTQLDRKQWLEIHKYCAMYNEIAGQHKQPLLILLYALATLQISNLAEHGFEKAQDILETLDENTFYHRRMWTPFMICDETGEPHTYTGTVLGTKDNNGFVRVNGVPKQLKKETGVRFRRTNFGRNAKMPERNQVLSNLELGIGYTSFSVYNTTGRKEKEVKV